MMVSSDEIVRQARRFLYLREATASPNAGLRVEAIQRWCGGSKGESWCAYFVTLILDLLFAGAAPIPRQGGVQAIRDLAKKHNWMTSTPVPGDLFIYVNAAGRGHHIGFYTGFGVTAPTGIAGNTSADGTSSNGDRVAEHELHAGTSIIEYIAYPREAA